MLLISEESSLTEILKLVDREITTSPVEERFLTVDTEFVRENLKDPLLCLVQIASPKTVFIIDPMMVDITLLEKIFQDPKIVKVFHSAAQDLEILSFYGLETRNYYDTQLYEAILSTNAHISYQAIVLRYLNINLEKSLSLSDWRKRPLDRKQLQYAANDVSYLREIYKCQLRKLQNRDRIHWLDEELQSLTVKSINLDESAMATYRQLEEHRAKMAITRRVLPEAIATDAILRSICKKGIDFVRRMKHSRNVRNDYFREFLIFAETVAEDQTTREERGDKNALSLLLRTLLEICSKEHDVAPSMIATSGDLDKLADAGSENRGEVIKCFVGWRNEIFGQRAVHLLRGDVALRVEEDCATGSKKVMAMTRSW
jgi:ribonuclease D